MHTGGERSDSPDELVLDWFIAQLDTVRGRATLMLVAALAVVTAGYELATGFGEVALWQGSFWAFVVLGNLITVYILTVYQKPPHVIDREVLGE